MDGEGWERQETDGQTETHTHTQTDSDTTGRYMDIEKD